MAGTPCDESSTLRARLSRFATGVVVVSYRVDGQTRGLTVSSFTSVSLDPPLVLVSVARSARADGQLDHVPFTVNVLGTAQLGLALHFAGRSSDPGQIRWLATDDDLAPALGGALASFRCSAWTSYDGGDHRLHLGRVAESLSRADGDPLVFHRGSFWDGVSDLQLVAAPVCAA